MEDHNKSVRRSIAVAAVIWLIGTISAVANAAGVPIELYGSLPRLDEIQLSPDGKRLALVRTEGNERVIAILSLTDGKVVAGTRVGQEKLRGIEWADDDRLMIFRSTTARLSEDIGPQEFMNLLVFDVLTQKMTSLPLTRGQIINTVIRPPMVRRIGGNTVLFFVGIHTSGRPALVSYNLATAEQKIVTLADRGTADWFVDEAGRIVAQVNYDMSKKEWEVGTVADGKFKVVQSGTSEVEVPRLIGFGVDSDTVLVQILENNVGATRALSIGTAKLSDSPALPGEVGPLFDPESRRLVGQMFVTDATEYRFTDPARQRLWESVLQKFKGARVKLVSASAGFRRIAVRVDGRGHGLAFVLVDPDSGGMSRVGDVYQGLSVINETRAMTYAAGDGLPIRAYLTLPEGRQPSKLPLVVLPHGGPAARDTADFDWWAQALASQGYAVLQPNFRGSALGYRFISAGFGEWGRKMQTDLSDGVKHLADQGIVDPSRVCVVGASYGGYAALAGVSFQPGVYRCAVSVSGPANLRRMLQFERRTSSDAGQRYWTRFMGVEGHNDPSLEKISPSEHIEAITAPVLLIHGRDDSVVPYAQSDSMAGAMKRAGKSVELVTLKEEDHWLSRAETRTQMLQSSIAFLRKHNPPD